MASSAQLVRALERADWIALAVAALGSVALVATLLSVRALVTRATQWRLLLSVFTVSVVLAALVSYFALLGRTSSILSANALLAFNRQNGLAEETRDQVLRARDLNRQVGDFEQMTLGVVPVTFAYPSWFALAMGPVSVAAGGLLGNRLARRLLRS